MQTPAVSRRLTAGTLSVAFVVVALAAYRASLGASFYDDTYYVTSAVRLAQGARLFVDEMSLQALGQVPVVPFVKAWMALFGLSGLVLATRLLYVVVATGVVAIVSRLVRPTFTSPAAGLALAVVLLAPAYNLLAPSYNTIAILAFTLAIACCFAALRDDRLWLCALGGAAAALGSVAYPPLAFGALTLLLTFALLARSTRHTAAAVAGGLAVAAPTAAYILTSASLDDIRTALAYTSSVVGSLSSPLAHLAYVLSSSALALLDPLLLPMWALALIACLPVVRSGVRAWCLAAIPIAATVPGLVLIAKGAPGLHFGTSSSAWLLTCVAGTAAPALMHAVRTRATARLRLTLLALPSSIVGTVIVALVTSSSWTRGMAIVGLAPLAFVLLACWAAAITELGGRAATMSGTAAVLLTALLILFATAFGDAPIGTPRTLVTSGPYAGITMGNERRLQIEELVTAGKTFVSPDSTVVFLGQRAVYMLVGGRPYTNVTWLIPKRSDSASLTYYARHGGLPQVAFVDDVDVRHEGGYAKAPAVDPMLARIMADYTLVGQAGRFHIYRLR